jgi:hypothetical protein
LLSGSNAPAAIDAPIAIIVRMTRVQSIGFPPFVEVESRKNGENAEFPA